MIFNRNVLLFRMGPEMEMIKIKAKELLFPTHITESIMFTMDISETLNDRENELMDF